MAVLLALFGEFVHEFTAAFAPVLIQTIQAQIAKPVVMADVHADPGVQAELQDDLEQQIQAGGR